jgi:hypothetical protein
MIANREKMRRHTKDELLDQPLLSESELAGFGTDIKTMQEGKVPSIVGSQFWERVMAEMTRRQANIQIAISDSMRRASWAVAALTLPLVVAAFLAFVLTPDPSRSCIIQPLAIERVPSPSACTFLKPARA